MNFLALTALAGLFALTGCRADLQGETQAPDTPPSTSDQPHPSVPTKPFDRSIRKKLGKAVSAPAGLPGAAKTIVLGDLNGDGKFNAADGQTAISLSVGAKPPTKEQLAAGDFNHDGEINVSEVTAIRQALESKTPGKM